MKFQKIKWIMCQLKNFILNLPFTYSSATASKICKMQQFFIMDHLSLSVSIKHHFACIAGFLSCMMLIFTDVYVNEPLFRNKKKYVTNLYFDFASFIISKISLLFIEMIILDGPTD